MTTQARKNVSTACQRCRESKIKCDGILPTCSTCKKKEATCVYDVTADKRRYIGVYSCKSRFCGHADESRLSLRPGLEILKKRTEELTRALLAAGLEVPAQQKDDKDRLDKILESAGLGRLSTPEPVTTENVHKPSNETLYNANANDIGAPLTPSLSAHLPTDGLADFTNVSVDETAILNDWSPQGIGADISPEWPWMELFATDLAATDALDVRQPVQEAVALGSTDQLLDEGQAEDVPSQEMANQLAARFGSLHLMQDGVLRFFGTPATTHLTMGAQHLYSAPRPNALSLDRQSLLHNAGLDLEVEDSFESRLVDLYFSRHNKCRALIDEADYQKSRARVSKCTDEDREACSTRVLTKIICAVGASYETRYHPSLATFPRSLAEYFADCAKVLLEAELDSPSVATIQALLLLSSYEAGHHRVARSWLYSGMAMRLCFDLGLHINSQPYLQCGTMTAAEAHNRQMTFWCCYTTNYQMSFSLGRPFTLDASEITVPWPSPKRNQETTATQHHAWVATNTGPDQHDFAALITKQRIFLCDIVEPIARALYSNAAIASKTLQELSERATHALTDWERNLPDSLRLNKTTTSGTVPPQVLVLHMEYHYLLILVHRPWTSRRLHPFPLQGRGYRHARETCVQSACSIARCLAQFETQHSSRSLDVETLQILPSAALILIFSAVCDSSSGQSEVLTNLNTILRALDELSNTYDCARQHLDGLLHVQQRWYLSYRTGVAKRNSEASRGEIEPNQKRQRMQL